MSNGKCPICQMDATIRDVANPRASDIDCRNCGRFLIALPAQEHLAATLEKFEKGQARLSHAIRKNQSNPPFMLRDVERQIENTPLPPPHEQADILILWLGEKSRGYGQNHPLVPQELQALIGAWGEQNVVAILEHLCSTQLLKESASGSSKFGLTMSGWELFQELSIQSKDSRTAFMAMKFNEPTLDGAYRECFKPAVQQAGFELARLDENPSAGLIDDRLMVEIRKARFVVSDLTFCNLGVYWESGFAHGLGKHVFYTCNQNYFDNKKPHFDINHHHIVLWTPDDFEQAEKKLTAAIRNTLTSEAKMSDD